ncbi:hypothetical protein NQ317_010404, partial [Molorchus minor]
MTWGGFNWKLNFRWCGSVVVYWKLFLVPTEDTFLGINLHILSQAVYPKLSSTMLPGSLGSVDGRVEGLLLCHESRGNQVFAYTKRQQIMSDDNCLDASSRTGPVKLVRCHGMGGNQAWVYDEV